MKKFTNKHSDIIIAIIFIIVIPTALFYSIAAIVKSNLFNLSFMENKDNFILYFATMFASGISATITFIVLKVTLERNKEDLAQQKKDLDGNFKNQLNIKKYDQHQEYLIKIIEILSEIKGNFSRLRTINSMNIKSKHEFLEYSREDLKELFKNFGILKYYINKIKHFCTEDENEDIGKLHLTIKSLFEEYAEETYRYTKLLNNINKNNKIIKLSSKNLTQIIKNINIYLEKISNISNRLENEFYNQETKR